MIKKILLQTLMVLVLAGCQQENRDYVWYMQHPETLRKEIIACETRLAQGNQEKCEIVMRAAVKMQSVVNQMQEDPERFGQQVMEAEARLAMLNIAESNAREKFVKLEQGKAAAAELKLAQQEWESAKKASLDQAEEIKIFLAVLGLSSPD